MARLCRIGQMMVPVASAFGIKVLAWSENLTDQAAREGGVEKAKDLCDLMRRSDFVSIHQRLSPRTRGLVGAVELQALGRESYIINTSRGPIIQEGELIYACKTGVIAGAGLDVFNIEPLPQEHPLRTLPNVLALPHVGYGTKENYKVWFSDIIDTVRQYAEDGTVIRQLA